MATELSNAIQALANIYAMDNVPGENNSEAFNAKLNEALELLNHLELESTPPVEPTVCHECNSPDIVHDDNLSADDNYVFNGVDCNACNASWSNVYHFIGINRNSH